jgi:hypothetical protein
VAPESSFFGLSFVLVGPGAAFTTANVIEITKKITIKIFSIFFVLSNVCFPLYYTPILIQLYIILRMLVLK